jgi:hypothetical protein
MAKMYILQCRRDNNKNLDNYMNIRNNLDNKIDNFLKTKNVNGPLYKFT